MTEPSSNFFDVVERLREVPARIEAIREALPALERHAEPCGGKAVIGALTPLLTIYGVSSRTEAEWATFWGLYIQTLTNWPEEALRAAVSEYVADGASEFFPKPGPLNAICGRHAAPLLTALGRARRAVK